MKVNADLLEKYHNNLCTPQERAAVEDWLMNSEVDDLEFHSEKDKSIAKEAIWDEIRASLPAEEVHNIKPIKSSTYYMWKGAVAATLLIGVLGSVFYYFVTNQEHDVNFVAFHNKSSLKVNHISSREYNLAIAPETFAEVNEHSGIIELSGSILISPKKDIELNFDGEKEIVKLKKGQSYIILNNKGGKQGLIVVNEKNLIHLPPVMQKKLISKFGI